MAAHATAVPDARTQLGTSAHGSAIAVYESHRAAVHAIRTLAASGFDLRMLSNAEFHDGKHENCCA